MTDEETKLYFDLHGRPEAYRKLSPEEGAYYDGAVRIDLSAVEPMIALPFHPSNTYTVRALNENGADILREVEMKGEEQLGLAPGTLDWSIKDAHIYVNQIEPIKEQIRRFDETGGYEAPTLWLNPEVTDFFAFDNSRDLKDVRLENYRHMGKLLFPIAQ